MRLVLGNFNYSSWSLRAWLVARRAGLEFEEVRVPLFTPRGNALMAELCPAGRVPVLHHGDVAVWDSLAIAEYFAELTPALWPAERADRARARSLCAEMHSRFGALRGELPMNCRRPPGAIAMSHECVADIARITDLWSRQLDGERAGGWLFGDWSIADAFYAPVVLRFHTYAIGLPRAACGYVQQHLGDALMQEWIDRGRQEPEIIQQAEVA